MNIKPLPLAQRWDEAFLRVESYLRAHHLESRTRLSQLATEIIAEAQTRQSPDAADEPVALAMQVTHARIREWFARSGDGYDWTSERDRARGRLALVTANLSGRWSNEFFSPNLVPPELVAAIASFQFQPGPELRFSNMPPAPLEFGFDESERARGAEPAGWPLVRAASWWLMVAGLIGVAWAASH